MEQLKQMIYNQIQAAREAADENGFNEIKVTVTFEYIMKKEVTPTE